MKIIEVLNNEEIAGKEKLKSVKSLVKVCREAYGNEDVEVPSVKVQTTEGNVSIDLLSTDEKVAVATNEIRRCIANATAVAENVDGAVWDRAFEFAVSTNNILANIGMKSKSKY